MGPDGCAGEDPGECGGEGPGVSVRTQLKTAEGASG